MRKLSLLTVLALAVACGDKDNGDSGDVDLDNDGFMSADDCDDTDADINPDADELCDDIDNNCDGNIDELPVDGLTYYVDADADGAGDVNDAGTRYCEAPEGHSLTQDDCDDENADINPDAREVCDTVDNDCDGEIDDADGDVDLSTGSEFYRDNDGDSYGVDSGSTTTIACEVPEGFSDVAGDCDDTNADINPDTAWSQDSDGDGFGVEGVELVQCEQPEGFVLEIGDCDDGDELINPDASEVCDGADNDCDTLVDDDDDSVDANTFTTWYVDGDGDGYGTSDTTVDQCAQPSGYSDLDGDCDDGEAAVNPGQAEQSGNGVDDNCDGAGITFPTGAVDDNTADYVISSGATLDFGARTAWVDLNGDGQAEAVVAEPGDSSTAGSVYVWYGPSTSTSTASATLAGVVGEATGESLAGGDFDGDGYGDLLVGAPDGNTVYLMYGSATAWSGSIDLTNSDAILTGTSGAIGSNASSLGDFDGDGTDDLIVAGYSVTNTYSSEGAAYAFFSTYGVLSGAVSVTSADQIWYGNGSYNWLGYRPQSVTGLGDIDGDGFADLGLGCDYTNGSTGGLYLVYGSATPMTGSFNLDSGSEDAEFTSVSTSYNAFAHSVFPVGDATGDGVDDFIVSSESNNEAYLLPGNSTTRYAGENSTSSNAFATFSGTGDFGWLGGGGDFNGDGYQDLLVSAPEVSGSVYYNGAVYVWFGPLTGGNYDVSTTAGTTISATNTSGYEYLGLGVAIGDGTGDGVDDVLIGAPGGTAGNGEAFIFFGGDGSL